MKLALLQFGATVSKILPFFTALWNLSSLGASTVLYLKRHHWKLTFGKVVQVNVISHRTSTASSMTVISVLHLAEGLMASSAGGMTKLLLNGSHIPSPKVYVNLQETRRVCMTSKVKGFGFASVTK